MVIHGFHIIKNTQKFLLSAYFAPGHPVSHVTPHVIVECVRALSHTCTTSAHPVNLDNHTHVHITPVREMTSEIRSCTTDVQSLNFLHTQVQGFLSCHSTAGPIHLGDNFCKNDCLLYFSKQTSKKPQHAAITGNNCYRAHQKLPKLTTESSTIVSGGPVEQILECLNSSHIKDSCHTPPKQMYQEDQSDNSCHLG